MAGTLTPTRQKMLKENTVGKLFTIFEKKVKRDARTVDDETVVMNNTKTVGNVGHHVDVVVDFGSKNTVDRAGIVGNITRNTKTKFGQEDGEIVDESKLADPDHHDAELAAGDPLDRPEVWPDLGTENYLSHTETETKFCNLVYKHTSCDMTATLPSTSNLGFGDYTARGQHMLDNLWDGLSQHGGLDNRGEAAQGQTVQSACVQSNSSCDWTEQSESEAEWPIGSSKRDLLG